MLSFESEKSLGSTGDAIFLDIRHHILTARYGPCQLIGAEKLAAKTGVPKSVAESVLQALVDHGYLVPDNSGSMRVVHWTNAEFKDLINACHDLIGLAIDKCMTRIDGASIAHLREALDFRFIDPIEPQQIESFQIRWWMFFHIIISTIEVRSFRKMMLTGMPPALRRRVITSLDGSGLRSMLEDMTQLIDCLEARNVGNGRALLDRQFAAFTPAVMAANEGYNRFARDDEVEYATATPLTHPLFRDSDSALPPFQRGMREPLSWGEFKSLSLPG
jgi:DNA-binding GntR family transcriptional regulator